MPTIKINDQTVSVEPGTLLIDACKQVGVEIPHYCYHPALSPVATCRMCLVEIKGQPKLATSCTTTAAEGMEVFTNSPSVADARGGVMEFLLINHPLDCPICDQAGECKLQDYSYAFGSGDSRMVEAKRRYAYEELGAKIVIDKNRCIHCTRCVRFTQEVSGGAELTVANRGASLEITTYSGKTLDGNPLAGNVVDLCPVGALTSRDFRFNKRVWFLKPVPTISRHSAMASPIWADVDQNRVWRFRPRPEPGRPATQFLFDDERAAFHRYDLDPADRLAKPLLNGQPAAVEAIAEALRGAGKVAVVGQGTFGCDAAQRLALLASDALCFGTGDLTHAISHPELQKSSDGIFNRRGFSERGFRFGRLDALLALAISGQVGAVVLLHDAEFSSPGEKAVLRALLEAVPFSLALEPIPSELGDLASARLPVTTYLEESDSVLTHDGVLRRYQKALQAPKGVKTVPEWVKELMKG
ncbi:2Fe-2S iron-sulfur cluster-binding protein [Holophaga foetida]|uniref:2Fe-2S iron-sulfur cluster-binding protein n=1 Tax=Holophaga foetida TaxID=35839 RepID=UPI0002471D18|nr:2Fe-2S iron-sulfur cluster-binding protein [Holophaga foetida]